MSAADFEEGVNVSRQSYLVNNHYRLSARVDAPLDVGGVKVVSAQVHLGEYGRRAHISDGVRSGDEAERGHNHLIARPDSEGE
jgi:hypothetical protein